MTLNLLFSCLYFAASLSFALFEGPGICFAVCYLPALLFFRPVQGSMINAGIPDLTAATVASLAILIGMGVRIAKKMPFRWTLIDTLVLLAPLLATLSTFYTENLDNSYENLHATYNEGIKQVFGWVVPYFAARAGFKSERVRVAFLWTLVVSIFVLTPFALIEMRLWPQYYVQTLQKLGLVASNDPMVMSRMGYFRPQVSFTHPIYFGDACLSMVVLLLLLAHTTSVGTRNWWVRMAAACATAELLASLSF